MWQLVAGFSVAAFLYLPVKAFGADPYDAFSVLRLEKKPAPDFSLPQVSGKTVRLSDYKGRVFSWDFSKLFDRTVGGSCPPKRNYMGSLRRRILRFLL